MCNSPNIKKMISWCNNQAPGGIFYSQAGNASKPNQNHLNILSMFLKFSLISTTQDFGFALQTPKGTNCHAYQCLIDFKVYQLLMFELTSQ